MELASLQKQYYHLDLHSKNILFANAIDPEKCQPDDKIDSLESYNQNFEFDLKFVDRSRLVRVPKIWTCDERIRLIDYGQSTILVPQSSSNKFEHLKVHTASMRFAFQFIFADIKCSLWHYWNWRFRKDPTQRLAKDTILYMFMTIFGIENIQKTKTEIRKICKPSHVKNQLELQKNWSDMKLEKAIPHLSCDNKCLVSFWKVLKNYLTDFVF